MFDPLLLALTSGLSIFNHLKNNKHSEKLQTKQQEFARASVERNKQRMWELLREGQEITLQMEEEAHQARIQDINNDFDKLLHRLAYNLDINTWPLKVLPIVMKNQSLGTLLCGSSENVALHCILTPSNCVAFNNYVLPEIEDALTDFCNLHWSPLSAHPILFYSGAWKSLTNPTGIEVEQLRTDLHNLPILMITPYFNPDGGLVFQLNAWGIGNDVRADVECKDFSYADKYALGLDFKDDTDLRNTTIEELTSYLQCLIGYVADQYFWLMHNEAPLLPSLMFTNIISFDGKPYLRRGLNDYYTGLVNMCQEEGGAFPFNHSKVLSLCSGTKPLFESEMFDKKIGGLILDYCSYRSLGHYDKIEEVLYSEELCLDDLEFLQKASDCVYNQELSDIINETIKHINENIPKRYPRNAKLTKVEIYEECTNFSIDSVLNDFIHYCKRYNLLNISLLITQEGFKSYTFDTYDAETDEILCYRIPFNKTYKCQSVDRLMNVKDLFNDGNTFQISCSYDRIEVLKSKIKSKIMIY